MPRTTLDIKGLLVSWGIILLIWSVWSYILRVPEYILASPWRVATYVLENFYRVIEMVGLTASQAVVGWILGIVFGGVIGATIFYLPLGRRLLLPPVLALQTTPVIALAPLITFWLGYGWVAKVVVTAIMAMLPVVLAMYSGLGDAKLPHVYIYQLAGAGKASIFWRVRLPSAWTSVLASLKVAAIFAVIGSIVAEFMGGNTGLGFLIMKAIYGSNGQILITAVLCAALLGQVFLVAIEHFLGSWEKRFVATSD